MYAKSKMLMTRGATPTFMLAKATEFTGHKYKRGAYLEAAEDLGNWIETMKAALPTTDNRRPKPVKRAQCSSMAMVSGGEKTHPIVIDGGVVKEWVGIGWIDLHAAADEDYNQFPKLED